MRAMGWGAMGFWGLLLVACGNSASNEEADDSTHGGSSGSAPVEPGTAGASDGEGGSAGRSLSNGPASGASGSPASDPSKTTMPEGVAGATAAPPGIDRPLDLSGSVIDQTDITALVGAPDPGACETVREAIEEEYCQVDLNCDYDVIYTGCQLEPISNTTSQWSCFCQTNYSFLDLRLTGVDNATACTTMSELCRSREVPTFPEEETCSVVSESANVDYCNLEEECLRSAELAEGVAAHVVRPKSADCYIDAAGALLCQCTDGGSPEYYELIGTTPSASCEVALGLCAHDTEVIFDETAAVCEQATTTPAEPPTKEEPPTAEGPALPAYPNTEPAFTAVGESCRTAEQCTMSAEVSSSITALSGYLQEASCTATAENLLDCGCITPARALAFYVEAPAADPEVCANALAVCTAGEELAPAGEVACSRWSQAADFDSCSAQLLCTQPATTGGQSLLLRGMVDVDCVIDSADAPATCACRAPSGSATFEVDEADLWTLCDIAAERCPELVEVEMEGFLRVSYSAQF